MSELDFLKLIIFLLIIFFATIMTTLIIYYNSLASQLNIVKKEYVYMKLSDVEITGWKRAYVMTSCHTYNFKEAKKKYPDMIIRKINVVDGAIYFQE